MSIKLQELINHTGLESVHLCHSMLCTSSFHSIIFILLSLAEFVRKGVRKGVPDNGEIIYPV